MHSYFPQSLRVPDFAFLPADQQIQKQLGVLEIVNILVEENQPWTGGWADT